MAKISIDDRTEKSDAVGKIGVLPLLTIRRLYNAAMTALERLGDAANFIEVVKISPLDVSPNVEHVGVKLVIAYIEPYSGQKTRTERFLEIQCNEHGDHLEDFVSQKIIRNFQEAMTTQSERFMKQSKLFGEIIVTFIEREMRSGNYKRCGVCGHMPTEGERGKACSRCFTNSLR